MINQLFFRKLAVAFVVGFLGPLLTFLTGLSSSPEWHFDKAALVALITGCLAAGIRAVFALSPINLVPSDAQHSALRARPSTRSESGQVSPLVLIVLLVVIIALVGGITWSPWVFLLLIVVLLLLFA